MSLFADPTEHAANPPETWTVTKVGDRAWSLRTAAGTELDRYTTKRKAEYDRTPDGYYGRAYAKEGRWYAGETQPGWKPYADCLAERERLEARKAARAEHAALLERLTADGHDVAEWADDPTALRAYADAIRPAATVTA